jgi:hypothetical protein
MLNLIDHPRRLSRGEDVLAVYPDTTSFYPALVAAAPRRATSTTEAAVAVQFHGDENDKGKNTLDVDAAIFDEFVVYMQASFQ